MRGRQRRHLRQVLTHASALLCACSWVASLHEQDPTALLLPGLPHTLLAEPNGWAWLLPARRAAGLPLSLGYLRGAATDGSGSHIHSSGGWTAAAAARTAHFLKGLAVIAGVNAACTLARAFRYRPQDEGFWVAAMAL